MKVALIVVCICFFTIDCFADSDTIVIPTRFYSLGSKAIEDLCTPGTSVAISKYRGIILYENELSQYHGKGNEFSPPEGFGVDLLFDPLVWMSFGDFKDPLKLSLGVIPRVTIHGWKGFAFDVRSYFTLSDEIYEKPGYKGGTAVISQVVKFNKLHWLTGSFGWFTALRWGADLHWISAVLDNKLFLETRVGVTGIMAYQDTIFSYSKLNRFTFVVRPAYLIEKYKLLVQLEAGYYLNKDWGVGVNLKRRLGVFDIELSGLYTGLGANGGFSITTPLWFGRSPNVRRLRYGLGDKYRFKYRFKQYTPPAQLYETKVGLDEKLWEYNPHLLK